MYEIISDNCVCGAYLKRPKKENHTYNRYITNKNIEKNRRR